MRKNYWRVFAKSIIVNWKRPALTDYYVSDTDSIQETSKREEYTYSEMCREIFRLNEQFRALGLKRGDHIAICGDNSSRWIIAYLAIAAYQGIVVTVLHTQPIKDIAYQIDFSDAKALFIDPEIWSGLKVFSLPQVEYIINLADWSTSRPEGTFHERESSISQKYKKCTSIISVLPKLLRLYFSLSNKHLDDLSVICFTSGSTGVAKGVMVAHRVYSVGGALLLSRLPAPKINRNVMAILPFGHVFGLVDVNSALYTGAHVFVVRSLTRPASLMRIMTEIQPYRIMLIPMMIDGFAAPGNEDILQQCNKFLKYAIAGGAIIASSTLEKLLKSKFPLTIGYGQTEASPLISISSPWNYRKGSCGQIIEGSKARISPAGEILVKGENVMLGYYKDPEATARKIDSDGWLHTGDKGHLDEDGYLYVEGRLEQDIIVLPNGENIRPDNIESLINALPEVSESIVLARDGKLVAIVVVKNLPPSLEGRAGERLSILRAVNPQLPLFSQLYDVEISDTPLQRTEKQTIKRYLYK